MKSLIAFIVFFFVQQNIKEQEEISETMINPGS